MELAVDHWIVNDAILYRADQKMLTEIKAFMDAIAAQKESDPIAAFTELKAGLNAIAASFRRTQRNLAKLELLSDKI